MSKHKLLLADDSITIQKVVNLTFADEGIEVVAVGDGNSALEKFAEFMPDLVMADINMPGLNGYQICEIIKQNDETRNIPVILLVGSFEPFDEEEARRVGANDYLTKPFQSIRQLVTKVSELLASTENGGAQTAIIAEEEEILPPTERLNEQTASPFADTLEMAKFDEPSDDLGDAGMDDEMIQTSPPPAGYGFDETQKFQSSQEESDFGKTQPLTADDLREISLEETAQQEISGGEADSGYPGAEEVPKEEESDAGDEKFDQSAESGESPIEAADEMREAEPVQEEAEAPEEIREEGTVWEYGAETAAEQEAVSEEAKISNLERVVDSAESSEPAREAGILSPVFDFDDTNLLELPPRHGISSYGQTAFAESIEPLTAPLKSSETAETIETEAQTSPAINISPDVVDAIADRVVEKLSGGVVEEIVNKVVARMTEEKPRE